MNPWRRRNQIRRLWTRVSSFCRPWLFRGNEERTAYRKLFIVGAPRSGTSWVNTIFAYHPDVITERESSLYPHIMDPLRTHGARGPVAWREISGAGGQEIAGIFRYVNNRVLGEILDDAQRRLAVCPSWTDDDAASYVIRRIIDHFFFRHGGSPSHLFVEKSPIHVLYGREILHAFPEAKILHVLRDGRDVCASLEVLAQGTDWAPASRCDQIRIWKRSVEAGMALREDPECRERTEMVRYEELKRDPVSQITRLFTFVGLPATPRLVRRIARQTEFRRHRKKGPGQHNNRGAVGSWRDHFSEEDRQMFEQTAGDLLRRCGYDWEDQARAA